MSFAEVIRELQAGSAAKRPNWAGYVKKEQAEGAEENTYVLKFVKRDGTQTVYSVTNGVITVTSPLSLNAEFMAAMLSEDWYAGLAADFETARSGTDNEW